MGKDIDWDYIRSEFPEIDFSNSEACDGVLRRLLRPRDSGRPPEGENPERSGGVECEAGQSGPKASPK